MMTDWDGCIWTGLTSGMTRLTGMVGYVLGVIGAVDGEGVGQLFDHEVLVEIEPVGRSVEPEGEDHAVTDRVRAKVNGGLRQTQFRGKEGGGESTDWVDGGAEQQSAALIGSEESTRTISNGEAQGIRSEVEQLSFRLKANPRPLSGFAAGR